MNVPYRHFGDRAAPATAGFGALIRGRVLTTHTFLSVDRLDGHALMDLDGGAGPRQRRAESPDRHEDVAVVLPVAAGEFGF